MGLHKFDIISLSIICLGAIICAINTVTLWLQVVQSFTDTVHETKWTSHEGMTQCILARAKTQV